MNINVAYACNEAYMEQTSVSLISLFNQNAKDSIEVYFIDMGITEESAKELHDLVGGLGGSLHIIPFDDIAFDLNVNKTGRHTQSVYAKIFFGRINGIDKILYLDSDIIIADSLHPLWDMDLGECVCAGVETIHTIKDNEKMGLLPEERAINDGMVLMDLAAWRRGHYLEKCLTYIDEKDGQPPVLSEGTINAVCRGKIKIISPRYNLMSGVVGANTKKLEAITGRKYYDQKTIDDATKKPCIIHYLSGFYNRPWCKECSHPFKDKYLAYRAKSKWASKPLQDKKLPTRVKLVGFFYKYLPAPMFVALRHVLGKQ